MANAGNSGNGRKRSVMELAPLERDCMNMLWPVGEATVRDIREALAATRPRAYTTIMTIMDRLAHKGVVERRKVGKAYVYRPNLTAEQARAHAVERLVENYFDGSNQALASYLAGGEGSLVRRAASQPMPRVEQRPDAEAAKSAPTPSAIDETLL